eukprot:2631670-Pleurochrysis_carterae.AAC.1
MTSEYLGVRVSLLPGARSCQAREAQAHKPGRAVAKCATEERSKNGARQPRMNRLTGFDEPSPKSEGRKRTVGAMPVKE